MTWELLLVLFVIAVAIAAGYAYSQRKQSPYETRVEEQLKGDPRGRKPRQNA